MLSLPHLKPSALRHKDSVSSVGLLAMIAELAPPLPEDHAVAAPPPQVHQLQAVVTATAEHLSMVVTQVQRGDSALRRQLLNTAPQPEGGRTCERRKLLLLLLIFIRSQSEMTSML